MEILRRAHRDLGLVSGAGLFSARRGIGQDHRSQDVGGDVWRFFARFSAQGDLGGAEVRGGKSTTRGVYRNFLSGGAAEPEQFFRRAIRLWSQYHDTGTLEICGGSVTTNSVFMRLVAFHVPIDGFVRLQGFYLEEFGRLIGLELESKVTASTARGDRFREWEYLLARTPATEAYVTSLPPFA